MTNQTTAISATLFVANPGTGLDRLNRTDAQWLQTTGRLSNGAAFDMTTRDVNSGTRNVSSLDIGIDPSFSVGVNDNGNGNAANGATSQISIGSGQITLGGVQVSLGKIRFSEKTSGGAELKPTVQNARMAVGTLSVGDANGVFSAGVNNAVRSLEYSDSTDGSSGYVPVTTYTIITGKFALYQNEQFVTLKAPQTDNANFNTLTTAQWAQVSTGTATVVPSSGTLGMVPAQGDDATNTVSQLINNVQTSVNTLSFSTLAQSSFSYLNKGFLLQSFMAVEKPQNGIGLSSANPIFNAGLATSYLANSNSGNTKFTTAGNPDAITANPTQANVYGSAGTNVGSFMGAINLTTSANINGSTSGGNWLFGNFDQTGIRDFHSVVETATSALAVLELSGAGNSAFTGMSNHTVIGGPGLLSTMTNEQGGIGATKGDLIVLGDYDGRGVFDGRSLYEMAIGASIADNTGAGTAFQVGVNDHLTLKSQTLTVLSTDTSSGMQSATAVTVNTETFGDAVRRGTLYKNAALDYLNANTTPQMKIEATTVLAITGNATNVPVGATDLGADPVTPGTEDFTYDPTGASAFDKHDVNRDGVTDVNDALLVDKFNGTDYTDLGAQITATMPAPVTGNTLPINLVNVSQVDSSTVIGSADLTEVNTGLAATGNANWYGYTAQKTGTGAINWGRTAGTVTVYSGAALQVSKGTFNVGGTLDPFTDNSGGATNGTHVAVAVDHGAKLALTNANHVTVSSLTVDTASSSMVDVGKGSVSVDFTGGADPVAGIVAALTSGYNNGSWTGAGINSSNSAASIGHGTRYTVGYADGNADAGYQGNISTPNQILVKYTIAGDANLDGKVNISDLAVIAQNYNQSSRDYAHGNLVYTANGLVGIADLGLIAQNYNKSIGSLAAVQDYGFSTSFLADWNLALSQVSNTTVPEPGTLSLMALGATGLLARRRRRASL